MSARIEIPVYRPADIDFTSIGQFISLPRDRTPNLESDIIKFFGGIGTFRMGGPLELGFCEYDHREYAADKLERHVSSQELIFAADADFIMVACPAGPGKDYPEEDRIIALRINKSEGVLFNEGVWHWVPYPVRGKSFALVGFTQDTATADMTIRDLKKKVSFTP